MCDLKASLLTCFLKPPVNSEEVLLTKETACWSHVSGCCQSDVRRSTSHCETGSDLCRKPTAIAGHRRVLRFNENAMFLG